MRLYEPCHITITAKKKMNNYIFLSYNIETFYFKSRISCVGHGFSKYNYGKFQLVHIQKELLSIQNQVTSVLLLDYTEML